MNKRTISAWMGAAMAIGVATERAPAQAAGTNDPKNSPVTTSPFTPVPPKKVRPVRKSVVDLDTMAKDRRPGQVMPGDPAPMGGGATRPASETVTSVPAPAATAEKPVRPASNAVPAAESAAPASGVKPIKLPDTAPYNKPALKPTSDSEARPEVLSGTMPANAAPAAEASAPVEEQAHPVPAPAADPAAIPPVASAPVASAPTEQAIERPQVAGVTLVDGVVMTRVPAALSTGPASVHVESISGDAAGVQWRIGNGAWTTPVAGETVDGKVEIRAGLDAQIVLTVDGIAQVQVPRLGRATIERCMEPRGGQSVGVNVQRGAAEIRPLGASGSAEPHMFARVRTPDQSFGLTGPLRVEYDAFTGTRRRVVNQ